MRIYRMNSICLNLSKNYVLNNDSIDFSHLLTPKILLSDLLLLINCGLVFRPGFFVLVC